MKLHLSIPALAIAALLASTVAPTTAVAHTGDDNRATADSLTRAQVRMEAAEFVRTHRWEPTTEMWVLKEGIEPPAGVKSRAQVKAERDEFLRTHRWDTTTEDWKPITPEERSTLSRRDVRAETQQFAKTHEWDTLRGVWVHKTPRRAKQ